MALSGTACSRLRARTGERSTRKKSATNFYEECKLRARYVQWYIFGINLYSWISSFLFLCSAQGYTDFLLNSRCMHDTNVIERERILFTVLFSFFFFFFCKGRDVARKWNFRFIILNIFLLPISFYWFFKRLSETIARGWKLFRNG